MWYDHKSKQERFNELLVRLDALDYRLQDEEDGQKQHDVVSTICGIYTEMVRYYPDEYDGMDEKYKAILRKHLR